MALWDLFNNTEFNIDSYIEEQRKNFDINAYNKYNEERIQEFIEKYDLTTIDGIRSIPISEAQKYADGGKSVVYMPEQILKRKATEYKKLKKFNLAVECLKKFNELAVYSFYAYTRADYEKVVDMMVLGKMFNEAKEEHKKLNNLFGTRLEELKRLQNFAVQMDSESKESYQKRVIEPYIEESNDREHYYWLLENLPNLAPKSFSSFRRMKNTNSDNYQKILNEVIQTGNNLNEVHFWKQA